MACAPGNPHPLSTPKTELLWEGKYDEYGNPVTQGAAHWVVFAGVMMIIVGFFHAIEGLVALFRDNSGSSRLFRSFSTDNGQTWSPPTLTNYPNSSSKLFSLHTGAGPRLLIRDPNKPVDLAEEVKRDLGVAGAVSGPGRPTVVGAPDPGKAPVGN